MKAQELAAAIQSVKVMQLEPDDTIVFKTRAILTNEVQARIRHELTALFPQRKIVVLGDGSELEIVRPKTPSSAPEHPGPQVIWQYYCVDCGTKREGLLPWPHNMGGYSWSCPECKSHNIGSLKACG